MTRAVEYYRKKIAGRLAQSWMIWKAAHYYGLTLDEANVIMKGGIPEGFTSDDQFEYRLAGERLLKKPSAALISQVFSGSYRRYAQCVRANFMPEEYLREREVERDLTARIDHVVNNGKLAQ